MNAMRVLSVFVAMILFGIGGANPQTAQRESPNEQALTSKLLAEIGIGLKCASDSIDLKAQLAAAQTKIKALEDKYEPKPDPQK